MRFLVIGLVMALAACGGSSDSTTTDPSVATLQAKVDALQTSMTQALAAATHADAQKFDRLQLIGKVHGVATAERTLAIGHAAVTTPDFGPCADMGVLVSNPGFTTTYQGFKQCTGYYAEYAVKDGTLRTAQRLFWDGPNCTGNMLEWNASGFGYNDQILSSGIVFKSPTDASTLMVDKTRAPQTIQIQSVWVDSNPGCQSDIEPQFGYFVIKNDFHISGVPDDGAGPYELSSP